MNDMPAAAGRDLLNKVPEAILFFWIIKILPPTEGETAADFADQRGHKVLAEKLRSMNQPKKDPPL